MEGILRYHGYHGCASLCRIRVYEGEGKPPVVIATECESNPGTSVTNRIEVIATEMYRLLERPDNGITIIEHYEDRAFVGGRPLFKETFDLVMLTWTRCQGAIDPKWTSLTKAQAEEILGQPLSTPGGDPRPGDSPR